MKVEAIYKNGRLEFTRPIQLKRQRIRVRVDIPGTDLADDELVTSPGRTPADQDASGTGDIRERIRAILGADWEKLAQGAAELARRTVTD